MEPVQAFSVNGVTVGVADVDLLQSGAEAVMLSANNNLAAGSSWSLKVDLQAGRAYAAECRHLARSAGPDGLARGSAVMTGGGALASGGANRWVIQAITTHYKDGIRTPADKPVVYSAVRAGLEKAELFRAVSVATYLMVQKSTYHVGTPDDVALALCRALLDHAAIASSVRSLMICETDPVRIQRATAMLRKAHAERE